MHILSQTTCYLNYTGSEVVRIGQQNSVGSVKKLSELWDVPVYIHQMEMPYVTGKKDYPVADPSVDEGMVAKMSPAFPHTSIDISFHAVALPNDGSVPGMPGWKWIHTPGHTEGHVSLFREKDNVLIDNHTSIQYLLLFRSHFANQMLQGSFFYALCIQTAELQKDMKTCVENEKMSSFCYLTYESIMSSGKKTTYVQSMSPLRTEVTTSPSSSVIKTASQKFFTCPKLQ